MRIVVDDIAASKTGALSVLRDFYNYILENEKDHEWIFVLGDKLLDEKDNIKVLVRDDVKSSRKKRLEFDLRSGAEYFSQLKPDILFSMQNTLPRGYKGKQALYVHQPLPYQTWKRFSVLKAEQREYAIYQFLIGRMIDASVKLADKVMVQTGWMKDAVAKKTGIPSDRIVKIMPDVKVPEGVLRRDEESLDNSVIHNRFFYPAGEILYKNHGLILEAVRILAGRGVTDFEVAFTLKEGDLPYLDKYGKVDQVRYLGRIPREEVFARYKKEILLFPSYIETFGYPPAESRAVGGRILASDCPFCHEILDGYGRAAYFDPFDPVQLADLMEEAIKGNVLNVPDEGPVSPKDKESGWKRVTEELINMF